MPTLTRPEVLGTNEYVTGWRFVGPPPAAERLVEIGLGLVRFIDMTPDPDTPPVVSRFPNSGGLGGEGCQVYITLTDSYLVLGTWTALCLTRVLLSSCKPYGTEAVGGFLIKELQASAAGLGHFWF